MRIVFMGTPAFAVPTLAALHEAGHEIVAVYSQPPRPAGRGQKEMASPVHMFANQHQWPVYTPTSLKTPDIQAQFASHRADVAVVVAYGLLLPKAILEAYPLGCINVHPSLLPRWRGAAPMQRTIMAGDRETGIVIMQMDEGMDTGDMLMVKRYPIPEGTSFGALHDLLSKEAAPMVVQTLSGLQNKTITPQKQPAQGVTYAKKIIKQDLPIKWTMSAQQIYQHILALSPVPGAVFAYNREIIKVFHATPESIPVSEAPGTVLDKHLSVACGSGILRLNTLQRAGKKRMSAEELLHGYPIPMGTVLE
jgi:methionyl-tRNA formyltransferase